MSEEGYIKFKCNWIISENEEDIIEINKWRQKLFDLNLIGAYDNGIGFGNISVKLSDGFLITGSATGNIKELGKEHYVKVIDFDYKENTVDCIGPIKASSESLTHAAVYESDLSIKAVIHIHNKELWDKLINKVPTTSEKAEYGTIEIADEIKRLFKETDVRDKKIIAMAGHEEGIISFGKDLEEAGKVILEYFNEI